MTAILTGGDPTKKEAPAATTSTEGRPHQPPYKANHQQKQPISKQAGTPGPRKACSQASQPFKNASSIVKEHKQRFRSRKGTKKQLGFWLLGDIGGSRTGEKFKKEQAFFFFPRFKLMGMEEMGRNRESFGAEIAGKGGREVPGLSNSGRH